MKKLFLGFVLGLFSVVTFASTSVKKDLAFKTQMQLNTSKKVFDEAKGICHITVYDGSTGSVIGEWFLPCNTAAACKKMLEDTLAAYN